MPDLSGRHSVRNVKRKFDPSMRLVRLVSSPVRSLTTRVPMRVDVTPNPIDDTFGYRIPLVDQGRWQSLEHVGTIDIFCQFPAALVCPWKSS